MPYVSVTVKTPKNRRIYIDGGYAKAAGNSSAMSFVVPTSRHVFETLNQERRVDNRKTFRARLADVDTGLTIELDPVDPPETI